MPCQRRGEPTHTPTYMKGGKGEDPPRNPALHLVPSEYLPPTGRVPRQIDPDFVREVVANIMKLFTIDTRDIDEIGDAMVEAWATQAESDPEFLWNPAKVIAFLNPAVRHDLKDLWKKRRVRKNAQAHLIGEAENRLTAVDPLTRMLAEERNAKVGRAIERLPEMQRRVCAMHFLEEKERAEISELLGISPKTYDIHLRRGIAKLQQMLHEFDPRTMRKEEA